MQFVYLRNATLVCGLTAAIVSVGATGMHAQDNEQATVRFELGQRLGECLVRGCVVFTSVVQSLGTPQKEPGVADEARAVMTRTVDIKVGEWLYGQGSEQSVQLIHAVRPAVTKTSVGPWSAWEGVTLNVGGQLLVALWSADAPRATWMGKPEDVAMVVSDTSLFTAIRDAISQQLRFERDPDEVSRAPQLLRDKPDVLFRTYLLTYLMEGEATRDVDKAAGILSGLLGQELIPVQARSAVADWLASTFYRLSEPTRKAVTEALVVSANADDASVANPALTVLIRLGDLQLLNLRPALTPARQRKIAENYRTFRAQHTGQQEHPEFELQLGVR
jgi:hypothetical protein